MPALYSEMSSERKAIELYRLVSSGIPRTQKELANILEVDVKTIRNFVNRLQDSWGTDMEYVPGLGQYIIHTHGLLKEIRVAKMLSSEDILLTLSAIFQTQPFNPYRIGLIQNALLDLLTEEEAQQARSLVPDLSSNSIKDSQEFDMIKTIKTALTNTKKLAFRYKSQGAGEYKPYIVTPYSFACDLGKYYLIARCDELDRMKHFRIDRMKFPRILDTPAQIPDDFNIQDYLKKTWYMYSGEETRIVVKFKKNAYEVVTERNMSDGQLIDETEEFFTYEFKANSTGGIFIWLMGFGDAAEILEPIALRERAKETIKNMVLNYGISL